MTDKVSKTLKEHYFKKFMEFGATPKGVDWGKMGDVLLRYRKMMEVIAHDEQKSIANPTVLDVGCGYGGLFQYCTDNNINLKYTGIDVCENMIEYAKTIYSDAIFICDDVFNLKPDTYYDYVICNGILTQKLGTSQMDMDDYSQKLIFKMFELSNRGIVFNLMSTKVNFMVENLYYRNPVELFGFCFTQISPKIRIDHTYPLFEYSISIYKNKQ
jgi:SAM-dependent methyltransferase